MLQPPNCLSLAILNSDAWNKLLVYCHNHPNLNCPILPAFLDMSLDYINFIVIKHFPGDTNFDKMTQVRLLWLTLNGFFGEV